MKKLQKEFTGNYDKVGMNKFVQIRKENGVAVYERYNTDAYDCRTLDQVERRFDELVEKVKLSAEAKEEAEKTGKPNKGRRSNSTKKDVPIPAKGTKFNMKFLVTNTGIDQPTLFPIVKRWEAEGLIQAVGTVKAEGGKGRPSIQYEVI